MSKSTFGWRQAGFAGVAAALVCGGTLVGAGTATAAASTLTASAKTAVSPGVAGAAVGNLTYSADNVFVDNATVAFRIAGNDCTTPAGVAKAIGFASAPAVAASGPATVPGVSNPAVLTKSNASCADPDIATVTLTDAAAGDPTDRLALALTGITYNVGADAPLGDVTVNATGTGGLGNASAANAVVRGTTLSLDGFTAAIPGTNNVALGTATIGESASGASFPEGSSTVVSLDLSNDTALNTSVLAGVTVSSGHSITNRNFAGGTFNFTVNTVDDGNVNTAPPAATVTVTGLRADAGGSVDQINLTTNLGTIPSGVKALNVAYFNDRIGGSDRFETAAKMFNEEFGETNDVVLSSGVDFPDALSASYLAGQKNTGILLTTPGSLSPAAFNSIVTNYVSTVYITGGTGAVSQAVQDKIEATNVGNQFFAPKINVVRLGGADRYATNKKVNENEAASAGTTVLVATGENFPDALGLGPIAASEGFPIVLTAGSSLSSQASAQLDAIEPTNVVIAGGTGVVSQSVADAIAAKGITVSRLAGSDRTETAGQVAVWASSGFKKADGTTPVDGILGNGLGFGYQADIANGATFADALAAGPYAGDNENVILLTDGPTSLGSGTPAYLGTKDVENSGAAGVVEVFGLGLNGAVSNGVLKAAAVSIQK